MKESDTTDQRAKTVEKAFDILEYLKEQNGANLDELTDQFQMAKSTAHRYVTTLEHRKYVVKEGNQYYPSLRFVDFARYARNRKTGYAEIKEKVTALAEETGERVQFLVEEHGKAVYVYRSTGPQAIRAGPRIGDNTYLHTAAAGKAILAQLPKYRVNEIVDRYGLPAVTDQTVTDRDELFEILSSIRERGYSLNEQESVSGLNAVGVHIPGPNNEVLGAISVAGPSHRMKGEWFDNELPDRLLGIANELELNLGYS
ncbi:IclR family transcriptional regulator [Halobellus captivus]|uniref:IclR family transcriptional regulator n=1 Tax=Halobellus captivus TaxID=2592614 RepID=UPI0011A2A454|nr:IclR family transcriptional regulator [Halobellus captivus]